MKRQKKARSSRALQPMFFVSMLLERKDGYAGGASNHERQVRICALVAFHLGIGVGSRKRDRSKSGCP